MVKERSRGSFVRLPGLARLLRKEGRAADASEALRPVYSRFTEGFDTADLKSAEAALTCLFRLH